MPELLQHFKYTSADVDDLNLRYLEYFSHIFEGEQVMPDYIIEAMYKNMQSQYNREYELLDSAIDIPISTEIYKNRTEGKLYKPKARFKFFKWRFGKNRPAKFICREEGADADRSFRDRNELFYATYPEKKKRRQLRKEKRAAKLEAKKAKKQAKK